MIGFEEKPPEPHGDLANAGVYLTRQSVFDYIPPPFLVRNERCCLFLPNTKTFVSVLNVSVKNSNSSGSGSSSHFSKNNLWASADALIHSTDECLVSRNSIAQSCDPT